MHASLEPFVFPLPLDLTLILVNPGLAFAGTVTVTDVAVNDKMVAGVPLKFTVSGAVKFVPVIVTVVPANPNAGVKLLMVGG